MSALGELWQWLQGRTTGTRPDPGTTDTGVAGLQQQAGENLQGVVESAPGSKQQAADAEARIQRNWRYRAGPWQQK